jgi:hypothetical protein
MDIESVTLELSYDYFDKEDTFRTLRVAAEPKALSPGWPKNLAPYFQVNTADVSGRKDGTGDFYRIYTPTSTVQVTAPATFGYWRFDQWINKKTGIITDDPTRTITFTPTTRNDPSVYAQYIYEGPILNVADFNLDYGVDLTDFHSLAAAWMTTAYNEEWDSAYDISTPADDVIDIFDLQVFCENWLEDAL